MDAETPMVIGSPDRGGMDAETPRRAGAGLVIGSPDQEGMDAETPRRAGAAGGSGK